MKTRETAWLVGVGILLASAGARAEDGSETEDEAWQRRVEQNHEERLRYMSQKRIEEYTRLKPGTRRFECRMESLLDGTLMVSKEYDPKVEPLLLRFGHRKVDRPPGHGDRVLYDGRSYQVFLIRDDIPMWKVEKHLGQEVQLELETFERGGAVRVVRIREPERPAEQP